MVLQVWFRDPQHHLGICCKPTSQAASRPTKSKTPGGGSKQSVLICDSDARKSLRTSGLMRLAKDS